VRLEVPLAMAKIRVQGKTFSYTAANLNQAMKDTGLEKTARRALLKHAAYFDNQDKRAGQLGAKDLAAGANDLKVIADTITSAFAKGNVRSRPMNAAMIHTYKDGLDITLKGGTPATVFITGAEGYRRTATVEVRPKNTPYPFLAYFDIAMK
jgi:hypothetical protein